MATGTGAKNQALLSEMWAFLGALKPDTPLETLTKITSFYEPDCVLYFSGMDQPPATSYSTLISQVQTLLTYWAILERRITTSVVGEDGKIVCNAMRNKLAIIGKAGMEEVDDFWECEVVTFSEGGKIQRYELFGDPGKIVKVLMGGQ
jgi:hypothetical protein